MNRRLRWRFGVELDTDSECFGLGLLTMWDPRGEYARREIVIWLGPFSIGIGWTCRWEVT